MQKSAAKKTNDAENLDFAKPIRKTAEALGIAFNTVSAAVNRLVSADILVPTSNTSRNRTFAYEAYLAVLRKGT